MESKPQYFCDGCHKDITTTSNSEDWRLVLTSQPKMLWYEAEGLRGGVVTDVAMRRPIDRSHHFCNLKCLDVWRAGEGAVY